MTLRVELVVPEGEVWSGPAELVIAKTMDGDIGVLTNHAPVLGILAPGSVVTIKPEDAGSGGDRVAAAVGGGFFAVADNRVSILAHEALLGSEVDVTAARGALDKALQELEAARGGAAGAEEPAEVRYLRAQLRAAGEPDAKA